VVIVDDHLALLATAGRLPELDATGPVATTYAFQFRMARAVADSARVGSLSRRLADPMAALQRVLRPPAHRLIVLDPLASIARAVDMVVRLKANPLLAELVGAALQHGAAVRVTPANEGKTWRRLMQAEGINFATVEA
jgi:hypothetical protein